jgi:hypothetical protein
MFIDFYKSQNIIQSINIILLLPFEIYSVVKDVHSFTKNLTNEGFVYY